MRIVSLMKANQEFSKLVKEVERGEGFLITRRGRPIAKLVPPHGRQDNRPWMGSCLSADDGTIE